jgi:hypothetical protein
MVIEHFVDGIGHRRFQWNRGNFPVTKFQHAHKTASGLDCNFVQPASSSRLYQQT